MKLKYYLRGAGIGIIFATLVMTLSSFVHKNNISDEYIIKEARKLGMIMREEADKNNNLFVEETEDTEDSEITEDSQTSEDTQVEESETPPSESEQIPVVPEPPVEPDPPVEPEPPVESESESESEPESESESDSAVTEYVTIVVEKGDYARQVAEKVKEAGLVDDAEDFRKYMGNHGYAQKLHAGTYKIPVGADYEEICKILISR